MAEPCHGQEHGPLQLYRSRERALLPLDGSLHCPRSLRRFLRGGHFRLSLNRAFSAVVSACADRSETWISPALANLYQRLHRAGLAHSVEAWQDDSLAAGLLAISIGRCWMGESMAHVRPQAGNVLLVQLVEALRRSGFTMFDVQLSTPHLRRYGCVSVSDATYREMLGQARALPGRLQFGPDILDSHAWTPSDAKMGADKKQT